jgi:glucose/arabinose dehydrogenase
MGRLVGVAIDNTGTLIVADDVDNVVRRLIASAAAK